MKLSTPHEQSSLLRLVFDTAALRQNCMKIISPKPTLVLIALLTVTAFGGETTRSTAPRDTSPIIYVADFELGAANIKINPAAPPKAPGLLGKVLPPPPTRRKIHSTSRVNWWIP